MIVSTTDSIPGKKVVAVLGLAKGSTVRCTHVGTDFLAFIRNLVGGEIPEYTRVIAQAREQAIDRMTEQARQLGANAILSMRFSTTEISRGGAEIVAYGTAVLVE